MSGYSSIPLIKKLGIKEKFAIKLINPPLNYQTLVGNLPTEIAISETGPFDFIHLFTNSEKELKSSLPILQNQLVSNGMIWVSWYKKASKKHSEITEDLIRETALALKLVDVKVCSIDDNWSGLKLVIRKELR
jgi:hypothetical protein